MTSEPQFPQLGLACSLPMLLSHVTAQSLTWAVPKGVSEPHKLGHELHYSLLPQVSTLPSQSFRLYPPPAREIKAHFEGRRTAERGSLNVKGTLD